MKGLNQAQIAQRLGISKSYLSMILNGKRKATPELLESIKSIPEVHNFVNNHDWALLHTQEVIGSNPIPPTFCYVCPFPEFYRYNA